MVPIVNARGVPGALGGLARGPDGTHYFISCQHVLFGAGAGANEKVFAIDEADGRERLIEIGRTARGFLGRVTYQGQPCFIDCAIGVLTCEVPDFMIRGVQAGGPMLGVSSTHPGARVSKQGSITGRTQGTVTDVNWYDRPLFTDRLLEAPGQLLISPSSPEESFSVPGESGCAVIDENDRVVGFLWGCNQHGEGIACPATPALQWLGITLEPQVPAGRNGEAR